MVKKNKTLIVASLLVLSILVVLNFISADPMINFSDGAVSITVNEDVNNFFNITVNNSYSGAVGNLTNFNVSLWGNFNFIVNSNGSDPGVVTSFSNTSTILSWINTTYLINGSTKKYFWFNATASIPGTYNITITTANMTNSYLSNLSITVNDTNVPVITLISPANGISSTTSSYNFTFNATDESSINCSLIFDGAIINTMTTVNNLGGTNGMYNSSSIITNHTWSVNCTDSFRNTGNSTTRILIITAAVAATISDEGGGGGSPSPWTTTKVLSDAEFEAGAIRELATDERVKVSISSVSHYISVTALTSTTATIEVSSTPQTAVFNIGDEKKLDVNDDGYYDIYIKLNSIISNKATITIKNINEKIYSETTTIPAEEPTTQTQITTTIPETLTSFGSWVLIIVILVVILAVIFYFFFNKKSKSYKSSYKLNRRK